MQSRTLPHVHADSSRGNAASCRLFPVGDADKPLCAPAAKTLLAFCLVPCVPRRPILPVRTPDEKCFATSKALSGRMTMSRGGEKIPTFPSPSKVQRDPTAADMESAILIRCSLEAASTDAARLVFGPIPGREPLKAEYSERSIPSFSGFTRATFAGSVLIDSVSLRPSIIAEREENRVPCQSPSKASISDSTVCPIQTDRRSMDVFGR